MICQHTLVQNLVQNLNPRTMAQYSYKNFHAKGVDYLCLHRTNNLTIKAYFLQELELNKDVVNPHTHLYNFDTCILNGVLMNVLFRRGHEHEDTEYYQGMWYNSWNSSGTFKKRNITRGSDVYLQQQGRSYGTGDKYSLEANQIHTIRPMTKEVTMLLFQYKDTLNKSFLFSRTPPDCKTNLYKPMTVKEVKRYQEILLKMV